MNPTLFSLKRTRLQLINFVYSQEIIYEAFLHDAVMLFAMGFNNTILTREKQNRGFERDAVGGFGSEIRNEISKLTNITGNQRKYNLVKPI